MEYIVNILKRNVHDTKSKKQRYLAYICCMSLLIGMLYSSMAYAEESKPIDYAVLSAQQWLNETYTGKKGYTPVVEDGMTGNQVVKALITALQIELKIETPNGNFGPATTSKCPTLSTSSTDSNIVKILQFALLCKGYNPGGTTGTFGSKTKAAIQQVQTDAGITATGKVTPSLMKAILTTDSLTLSEQGDAKIRAIQQSLNATYGSYIGIIPCDGLYSRQMNKALIYALQAEEGIALDTANGNFGETTTKLCPNLTFLDCRKNYVRLLQYALYCNGYSSGAFDGIYDMNVLSAVVRYQSFMRLSTTGLAGMPTIKALLSSSGDTSRTGTACDCASIITADTVKTLKDNGYEIVGRYLTGTANGVSKALTKEEAEIILSNGLRFFPIFQNKGFQLEYFSEKQGENDANEAVKAATELGIPKGTVLYFAVDFDAYDYQVTSNVIPYFETIKQTMKELGNPYQIGVYGSRNICSRVSEAGYAVYSFVGDMSTGYSGNLGYQMPSNWAFDQIKEYSIGTGSGKIGIDKDICSLRDKGVDHLVVK